MLLLRLWLIVLLVTIGLYTGIVISRDGIDLLPIFFGMIATLTWPGQFTADFLGMLTLSGIWVAWRHHFTATGLLFGVLAIFFGVIFLSFYLLVQSFRVRDATELLVGDRAVRP